MRSAVRNVLLSHKILGCGHTVSQCRAAAMLVAAAAAIAAAAAAVVVPHGCR